MLSRLTILYQDSWIPAAQAARAFNLDPNRCTAEVDDKKTLTIRQPGDEHTDLVYNEGHWAED